MKAVVTKPTRGCAYAAFRSALKWLDFDQPSQHEWAAWFCDELEKEGQLGGVERLSDGQRSRG